jgi:protein-tyrosine phosphatase
VKPRGDLATDEAPIHIMTVCSANLVRSVLAEHLFGDRLERLAPGAFRVTSSGLRATDGVAAPPVVQEIAAAYGVDAAAHRSRRTDDHDLARVDTVLTASTRQRDEIVFRRPALLGRTFTIREFARAVSPSSAREGLDVRDQWRSMVRSAHEDRWRTVPSDIDEDDIPDPVGRSGPDAFVETERLVVDSLISVLRALDSRVAR